MVSCSPGENGRVAPNDATLPPVDALHGSVEPVGPWKHVTRCSAPATGTRTVALVMLVGTPH
jgi:hypothetical protein